MAFKKSSQMDFDGLEIVASSFKGDLTGTVAGALSGQSAVTVTYTTGDPSITPNGAVTVADGATPTVDELLELFVELNAKVAAIIAALD
jgi:hypothetical protein